MRSVRRLLPSVAAVWLLALGTPAFAESTDAVTQEMAALAQQIQPALQKQKVNTVHVSRFTPPANVKGGTGPELQLKLSRELQALGFRLDDFDYEIEIRGSYARYQDQADRLAVRITIEFIDAQGAALNEFVFNRLVYGEESVPRLLGVAVAHQPNADDMARADEIRDRERAGGFDLREGSRVAVTPESPYAIEVLTKRGDEYTPVAPQGQTSRNLPFVPIGEDELFAVKLYNGSAYEAAVNLTIDGISVFAFSELDPPPTYWLVPPAHNGQPGELLIVGWHKNTDRMIELKRVTDFEDTALAKLKLDLNPDVGQITASFSAAWQVDEQHRPINKPDDEVSSRGAGFGGEVEVPSEAVPRQIGHVRDVIHVRYER